jgi:uncharacterized membrane protein
MTENRWLLLLLCFCLLATAWLRFQELGRMVVWHDEVYSLSRVFGFAHQQLSDAVHDGRVHTPAELLRLQQPRPDQGLQETLHALQEHPEHSPLYYLLGWAVADWADQPIVALRAASALLSLLLFPAIFWLAKELADRRFAWLAVALASTSPVYFLYAREARQYALWLALITAASAALLRLLRSRHGGTFLSYALLLALALYTHLMTGLVMLAHALFIFMLLYRQRTDLIQTAKWVIPAWGLALLVFVPWIMVVLGHLDAMENFTGWMKRETTLVKLVTSWLGHITHLMVDLPVAGLLWTFIATSTLFLSLWALRHAPRTLRLLAGALILTSLAIVVVPDLLQGGRRSLETRYLLPLLLALSLVLAWAFTQGISSHRADIRRSSYSLLFLLLGGGLISQAVISASDSWWTKSFSGENAAFARLVNTAERPLIIGSYTFVSSGEILSLAHRLEPHVRILMEDPRHPAQVPGGYSAIFTFMPSDEIRGQLEKHYSLEPFDGSWKWSVASPLSSNDPL